ncbi:TetR/AcrR family transcriptional regulator [Vibrio hibernica]|uniref:TetR/AcrR family transcriptional regulator n=1 Tax=Vibrio hibernica TaxID=2587465 RepID=UPI00187FC284|nr:TetR/AcrR family transcriptional regulator [Vibrio hibernica]
MTQRKPSTRIDGELTRQRILAVAGKLFAINGFAETTNKLIAEQADVDLASINYHFGNRNGLYQQVLTVAQQGIIHLDELSVIAESTDTPQKKLFNIIHLIYRKAIDDNEWKIQLLAREVSSPTSNLVASLDENVQPKLNILRTVIRDLSGLSENSPLLTLCMMNIIAPCLMLIIGIKSNGETATSRHR